MSSSFLATRSSASSQEIGTKPGSSLRPFFGFVRFIGGGLAPYAAGKLAAAYGDHLPFYIGAGSIVLAIAVLATGHSLLAESERVQAAQAGHAPDATNVPIPEPLDAEAEILIEPWSDEETPGRSRSER